MTRYALITNDDGIDSPGLWALAQAAARAGLTPLVAAPSWDSSGASASLTAVESEGRLPVGQRTLAGVPGEAFAVDAAPAFIVRTAMQGAFGTVPDLVLSGINLGANAGQAVVHSGTVGAALTASNDNRSAMAISRVVPVSGDTETTWDTAARVAEIVIPWLVEQPPGLVVNVNVPDLPFDQLRGIHDACLAPFGAVQTTIAEVGKGYVKVEYAEIDADPQPDTDMALLREGWATITALRPMCERHDVDVSALAFAAAERAG